jgi:putative FmdB family regulatory protein
MPIYEYECEECGNRFEKMQPITAEPLKECPHCGKPSIRRVFHPVGVIFKGSGWYITDSRKGSDTGSSKPDSDKGVDKAAATDKGESKSETKSETSIGKESSSGAEAPAKPTDK